MSDRELNIIIKADGSVAVRNLGAVDAAIQKVSADTNTATPKLRESGAAMDSLGASAKKAGTDLPGLSNHLLAATAAAAKLASQFDALSASTGKYQESAKRASSLVAGIHSSTVALMQSRTAMKKAAATSTESTASFSTCGVAIQKIADSAGKGSSGLNSFSGSLATTAINAGKAAVGVVAVVAGAKGIKAAWTAANDAAQIQETEDSFRRFSNSVGRDPGQIMAALRQASGGTITDFNLIKTASKAMALQVTTDARLLGNLLDIARNKAKIFGVDVTQAFEDIVIGIGRVSPKILDNLGIRIPAGFEELTKGMSETQKISMLLTMTIDDGNRELAAMGGQVESANDSYRRLDVAFKNLYKSGGSLAQEILEPIVEMLGLLAQKASHASEALLGLIRSVKSTVSGDLGSHFAGMPTQYLFAEREQLKRQVFDIYSQTDFASPGSGKAMPQALERQLDAIERELRTRAETMKRNFLVSIEPLVGTRYMGAASSLLTSIMPNSSAGGLSSLEGSLGSAENLMGAFYDALSKKSKKGQKATDELGRSLQRVIGQIEKGFGYDGSRAINDVQNALFAATKVAGGLAIALKSGVTETGKLVDLAAKIQEALPEYLLGEKGGSFLESVMAGKDPNSHWSPSGAAEEIGSSFSDLFSWTWRSTTSEDLASWAKAKEKFRVDVAESFEAGLTDALEGGDFFESFGKSLRSQVVKAFAASVTASLFQGGGAFQVGGAAGSGFSVFNPSTWLSALPSTFAPQQKEQGSSTGGIGGLLNFGPMMKGGQVQWGNLTQYAAAGAALQFLTSPGRLFGGTVVHGQEAVQQASDINSRVSQARTDRQALIGTVGLSEDTVKKLSDLVFWTAGYNKNESGDGWLKGPKTTTYELNATQANAALEEFTKLTKQAQIDLAKRAYEIGTTQLDRPFTALQMSLEDLRGALNRTVDEESRYALQLQIKQAESQKQSFWAGNTNDWMSFLISTPMAGKGPGKNLTYSPGFEGAGFPIGQQTYPADPFRMALDVFERGFGKVVDIFQAKVGNTVLGPEEFESWAGTQVMMQGLRNQGSSAWDIQEQIARGAKPWDVTIGATGEKYTDILTDRLGSYQTMLDELDEKISDETLTMAQRSQLFSQFTAALTAYYGAKQEILDLELQQEADLKNKRDQRTDDILGTLLTRVGEISTNKAGQQILVLSPGQPDGRALVKIVIDAITGENPELAAAITKLVNQNAKPYF